MWEKTNIILESKISNCQKTQSLLFQSYTYLYCFTTTSPSFFKQQKLVWSFSIVVALPDFFLNAVGIWNDQF